MKFLGERHLGWDAQELSFPSISGCLALVYVTANGLYGFHNYGGADAPQWPGRSGAFKSYVTTHGRGGGNGAALYGVCYATGLGGRGYGITKPKEVWLSELASFAKAVDFKGPIFGYDLGQSGLVPSVVVEFNRVGATCVVQVRGFQHAEGTKGANISGNDHKWAPTRGAGQDKKGVNVYVTTVEAVTGNVVTSLPRAGFRTVYPEKLRG